MFWQTFLAFIFLFAKIGEVLLDSYKNYRNRKKVQVEKLKPKSYIDNTGSNPADLSNDMPGPDSSQTKIRIAFTSNRMPSVHNDNIISLTNPQRKNSSNETIKDLQESSINQTIELQSESYPFKNKRTSIYLSNQIESGIPFQIDKDQSPKLGRRIIRSTNPGINDVENLLKRMRPFKNSSYFLQQSSDTTKNSLPQNI